MIKAVIFDCFGVLTADKWKEFVTTLPKEQQQPARDFNHAYDAGHINESEFIDRVKKLTGRVPGEVENLTVQEIGKNGQLLDYIRKLRASYRIGLLSNIATDWVRKSFLTKEEQELFDAMVFSYEIGVTKPDPRIYRAILNKLGIQAQQAIFIDDTERYCQSAQELGMKSVYYQNFEQMKKELERILSSVADN